MSKYTPIEKANLLKQWISHGELGDPDSTAAKLAAQLASALETECVEKLFRQKLENWHDKYKEEMLSKTPEEMYFLAYDIAKTEAIVDYLSCRSIENMRDALPYMDTLINSMYVAEWEYNTAYWATWEELDEIFMIVLDKYRKKEEK